MTVTTVIAGQVKHTRTTVEQPWLLDLHGRDHWDGIPHLLAFLDGNHSCVLRLPALCSLSHSGQGRRGIVTAPLARRFYFFLFCCCCFLGDPVAGVVTPSDAWWAGIWAIKLQAS